MLKKLEVTQYLMKNLIKNIPKIAKLDEDVHQSKEIQI